MIHSVLKNVTPKDVVFEPFPYIVVDNALGKELYAQLEKEYPFEYRIDGYSGYENNARYQVSAVDGLRGDRLTPLWQEFVAYHTSEAFLQEVKDIFKEGVKKYYPELTLGEKVGVRFRDSEADFWMDCQPGMNSPVKDVSSVKGAHLDNEHEFFGGLLYFRHPEDTSQGGDLEVFRLRKENPPYYGARFIKDKYIEKVASVPYKANRLVLFLNTPDSIHGVSDRGVTPFTRRLVNFIGEVDGAPLFVLSKRGRYLKVKSFIKNLLHN